MRPFPRITMMAVTMLLPPGAGAADAPVAPPKPAAAAPNRTAVPAEFLEYLAAFEGDDENWTDFEVVAELPAAVAGPAVSKAPKTGDSK